jgi:hypothetical protein
MGDLIVLGGGPVGLAAVLANAARVATAPTSGGACCGAGRSTCGGRERALRRR